jgi:hypothetical protein
MTEQNPVFTAIQEDATSFVMDWPVIEPDESHEIHFKGTVFVLDGDGARIIDTPLATRGDRTADEALTSIGWSRTEGWHLDSFGRRMSRVAATATSPGQLPLQRASSARLGSLAEEASLHLS